MKISIFIKSEMFGIFSHLHKDKGKTLTISRLHAVYIYRLKNKSEQGPVVQSVVSLKSSLRVISLTVLVDSIHNILIFFAEKM